MSPFSLDVIVNVLLFCDWSLQAGVSAAQERSQSVRS